jgi:hypothetical protein
LYQDGKRILFNNKTWNFINKNEGTTVDWKSFSKIWNNKFIIQSFMGTIDSNRCKEFYTQILEKFKPNKRLNTELINYGREKKVKAPNEIRKNVHFITLFKSEEIYSLKNMEGRILKHERNYW